MKDGFVFKKGNPEMMIPWIASLGYQGSVLGVGKFPGKYDLPTGQVAFIELEVDVDTGDIKVLDYVSGVDSGTVVNPLAFQGQLDGYMPGMDLSLREETFVDRSTRRVLNSNMIDYKWRTFNELPRHRNVIMESIPKDADPLCPFGARGGGEQSHTPASPAALMALYNATGIRFTDYPITPEKILEALGKI
jgi:xanthine dehydrogenase molybdenum-binding subunit